ncbi:P32 adhesin-like isoform X3 [Scophthalmus maximus]|uniref:P32 adhesin-like isoform X2 n=1 Tax=Scophthalmus maximus TaxID=52904 RepID=UPI001FA88756|nr:P32 adhesin-like isoform X2 [Scophthalmus maximus]XP_047185491.1 P32 adhesin-like isoform X3 [Scophthalmus maximus]
MKKSLKSQNQTIVQTSSSVTLEPEEAMSTAASTQTRSAETNKAQAAIEMENQSPVGTNTRTEESQVPFITMPVPQPASYIHQGPGCDTYSDPAYNQGPGFNYQGPAYNQGPGFNYQGPAYNQGPGFNYQGPAYNQGPGFNYQGPAYNQGPGFNYQGPAYNQGPGFNYQGPAQGPGFNYQGPAYNQGPGFNYQGPAYNNYQVQPNVQLIDSQQFIQKQHLRDLHYLALSKDVRMQGHLKHQSGMNKEARTRLTREVKELSTVKSSLVQTKKDLSRLRQKSSGLKAGLLQMQEDLDKEILQRQEDSRLLESLKNTEQTLDDKVKEREEI